jgi:5-methylcytosine-specific restriction endonuclease McrA
MLSCKNTHKAFLQDDILAHLQFMLKNNQDKSKDYNKIYRQTHKESLRDYTRNWRKNHPENVKRWNAKYVEKNKDNLYAKNRDRWDKYRANSKVKRLKLRFEILQQSNFTCQYCGRKSPSVELQIDHKYPKSKGGLNNKNNYVVACADCNNGKRDVILNEFIASDNNQ